ncbi:hypothetical protein HanRHA438_Chr04g0195221 [Helianthus annuus]|nr:hypothetical protein HanRHA438_Chr04g0195221 [Helianthus annuus]
MALKYSQTGQLTFESSGSLSIPVLKTLICHQNWYMPLHLGLVVPKKGWCLGRISV